LINGLLASGDSLYSRGMGMGLATLLAIIVLGPPFGEATVEGATSGDGLRVEFEVVVSGAPVAVVVHAADPGQTQQTISLGNRTGGVWGGLTELDVMDFVVVFEAIGADGQGTLSEPTTLLELGLDPALIGMDGAVVVDEDDGNRPLTSTTRRWGWGAAALTAIALALLAVWAMGDRARGKHEAPRRAARRAARRVRQAVAAEEEEETPSP
jgi:hypothetical protein